MLEPELRPPEQEPHKNNAAPHCVIFTVNCMQEHVKFCLCTLSICVSIYQLQYVWAVACKKYSNVSADDARNSTHAPLHISQTPHITVGFSRDGKRLGFSRDGRLLGFCTRPKTVRVFPRRITGMVSNVQYLLMMRETLSMLHYTYHKHHTLQ
jgi:hypothetical protein